MAPLVAHDRLLRLYKAAVDAGLDRDALLTGIDRHLVAGFPRVPSLGAQFLVDLGELNLFEHRVGGDLPLRTWMKNALAMLGSKHEATAVRKGLRLLDASIKKNAASLMYAINWLRVDVAAFVTT